MLKVKSRYESTIWGDIKSSRLQGGHLCVLGKENPPLRRAIQDFAPVPGLAGCTATSFITEVFEEKNDKLGLVEESEENGEGRDVCCMPEDPLLKVERMRWYILATTP